MNARRELLGARGSIPLLLALLWPGIGRANEPNTLDLSADQTLTVAEMNHGDELRFRLVNGQPGTFVLEQTRARIVEQVRGGIVYCFECRPSGSRRDPGHDRSARADRDGTADPVLGGLPR